MKRFTEATIEEMGRKTFNEITTHDLAHMDAEAVGAYIKRDGELKLWKEALGDTETTKCTACGSDCKDINKICKTCQWEFFRKAI